MTNPLTDFINQRFIKPNIDKATASLQKDLNRANARIEEKEFDLLTEISGKFGVNSEKKYRLLNNWMSWVYANISVIAEKVADVQYELYSYSLKRGQQKLDKIDSHPLLDLLLRVNDYQTKWDLIYLWTAHMLSCGEAVWYLVGMNNEFNKPTEIWPLRPDFIKIIPGDLEKNQFVKEYEYHIPGKPKVIFKPFEILFFKTPHPTNAYRGYGVLEAAATDVLIDEYANTYNKEFFKNYARPDSVLMTENTLSDEIRERLERKWSARYQGVQNAGRTAILEKGLKYMSIQPTAKDMDFLEQQRWTRDKIMALFKNTKVILGITEDVNRANAESSEITWIKHNIKPKMQRLIDYINEFLVPNFGNNLILGFEDPVPQSVELKLQEYTAGVDRWLTRNEIREREGLDPVEGGDYLYATLTQSPLGEEQGNPNNEDNDEPDEDIEQEEQEEQPKSLPLKVIKHKAGQDKKLLKRYAPEIARVKNRMDREIVLRSAVNKAIRAAINSVTPHKGTFSADVQTKRWEMFVKIAGVFESQLIQIVQVVIDSHKDETINLIRQNYKPKAYGRKALGDLLPDEDQYVKVSIDAMRPILTALAAEQGKDVFEFLGMTHQFETSREVIEALSKFALKSSESYVDTVAERIRRELAEGVANGEGIEKLSKRITRTYKELSKPEAKRVARTETIRAANYATEEAFKQSKVVTGKQWFTALDERVDDACAGLDGKIVDIDGDFTSLDDVPKIYSDIGFPPLHPNCRCTISPVIISKSVKPQKKKPKPYRKSLVNIAKLKEEIRSEVEEEYEGKIDDVLQRMNNGD